MGDSYLPIDPADVGREYEPIIRISNQSGKGGAAFIMEHNYGYHMPKAMHPEFGAVVQAECDKTGRELTANEVYELFHREFLNISEPYALSRAKFYEEAVAGSAANITHFSGVLSVRGEFIQLESRGNGPIDAFFNALGQAGIEGYSFISYSEHAISMGSDSQAVAYIELRVPGGRRIFGASVRSIISTSLPAKGILSAIQSLRKRHGDFNPALIAPQIQVELHLGLSSFNNRFADSGAKHTAISSPASPARLHAQSAFSDHLRVQPQLCNILAQCCFAARIGIPYAIRHHHNHITDLHRHPERTGFHIGKHPDRQRIRANRANFSFKDLGGSASSQHAKRRFAGMQVTYA